jgi:hypothetical protein
LRRRIEPAEPRPESRRRGRLPVRRQSLSEHSVFLTSAITIPPDGVTGTPASGTERYSAALRGCCKIRPATLPTAARRNHDLESEPTLAGRPKPTAAPREVTPQKYPHEHEPRSGLALRAAVSLLLLRADGAVIRRLSQPGAADLSGEAPRLSREGGWVLFVRSRVVTVGTSAYSDETIELVRASGAGTAVPVFSFTSGDFSYYDHFDWCQGRSKSGPPRSTGISRADRRDGPARVPHERNRRSRLVGIRRSGLLLAARSTGELDQKQPDRARRDGPDPSPRPVAVNVPRMRRRAWRRGASTDLLNVRWWIDNRTFLTRLGPGWASGRCSARG